MATATRDLHKHVYRDDRTYHYSKIEGNLFCKKCEEYFKPSKLTGSSKVTEKAKIIFIEGIKRANYT